MHNAIIRGEMMQHLNPTSAMKHGGGGDIIWCRKPECLAITKLIQNCSTGECQGTSL